MVISLSVQVARSRIRLWKLWTGRPLAVILLARFRSAAGEGSAGATIEARASGGDGILVIEQHGFEALAHVPFDVAGEHAQKDVGAHPRRQPVVDRAEVQIDGLQAAKGALDMGEVLVGADDTLGRQGFVRNAGTDDVKTIEPSLGRDARGVAGNGEAVFGDADVEQL